MKTLYVLRHGQAIPEAEAETDRQRALTVRGQAEVRRTASHLSERTERSNPPSLILSSTATRARQTAELCVAALGDSSKLVLLDSLYLAEPASYLSELADHAEPHAAVMVVGHNPGLEALIYVLLGRSEHLATASLVEIELAVSAWAELSRAGSGRARIVDVFRA
jgi:phosphohistidine phosphatase